MSEGKLSAHDLRKRYRKRWVVDGVGFEVRQGEVVGLLGPNGAGKTTSFNMVVGQVAPDGGTVQLTPGEGAPLDLTRLPMHRRAKAGIGYLPQEASIFRKLTVRQNFLAVLETGPLTRQARQARADALLEEFGLAHLADSLGESLSGGERRRAEIARSLIPDPRFILFDEPFAGVDPINISDLQRQIGKLRERGLGILITDHNVADTLRICDRAYILAGGKILEEGTPSRIAASERARALYLGEHFRFEPQNPERTVP